MTRKLIASIATIFGVAALSYAAAGNGRHSLAIVAALVCFLVAASLLSRAGTLSVELRPLVGRTIRVEAWGAPLPGQEGSQLVLESVRGFSAALLIYLRPLPDGKPTLLKVAQPHKATVNPEGVEISLAAYVQWNNHKIKRPADNSAAALVIRTIG